MWGKIGINNIIMLELDKCTHCDDNTQTATVLQLAVLGLGHFFFWGFWGILALPRKRRIAPPGSLVVAVFYASS